MYKVLIVDDEPIICNGLTKIIPWQEYNFEIAGIAYNGKEAIEKIKETNIDLVITDIRMPAMDGLELCRELSQRYPSIKIIIISGYSDFDYARKAIEYDVKAYILKPIIPEELIDRLLNIRKQLDLIASQRREEFEKGRMLKSRMLYEFVDGYISVEEIRDDLKKAVENMDDSSIQAQVDRLMENIKSKELTIDVIKSVNIIIIHELSDLIQKHKGDPSQVFGEGMERQGDEVCRNKEKLREWIIASCREVQRYILEINTKKPRGLIDDVIDFVDGNFYEDLTLSYIAEKFYVNSAYLGQLFKETKGMSFSKYINRKRLDKAKELYIAGGHKIYEIIDMVGYKHPEHFYRQFKKYEGITFAEFRDRIHGK